MHDINTTNYTLGIIYFLILFFILIICKNITTTSIEGFDAADITRIANQVGGIADRAAELPGKIIDIGDKIANAGKGITDAVETKFNTMKNGIENGIGTAVSNAMTPINNTIGTIQNTVNNIPNQITTKINLALVPLTSSITAINTWITQTTIWIAAAKTQLASLGTTIAGLGGLIGTAITNALTQFKKDVIDPISGAIEVVKSKIQWLLDKVLGLPDLITGFFETMFSGFMTEVIGPIRAFIDEAKSKFQWVLDKVLGLPDLITGFFETMLSGFMTEVIDPIRAFIDEAKSKFQWVLDKLLGLPDLITGFFDTIKSGFMTEVIEKFLRFCDNLVFILTYTIVEPFLTLFDAIKNLFAQLKKIANKVIHKIVILPNCVILYMVQSIFLTINAIYMYFMPEFVVNLFSTIYEYTLQTPLEYLTWLIGFDDWWDQCYNFNVSGELDSITSEFKAVGAEFVDSFGHIDWSVLIDFGDKDNRPKRTQKEATILEKLNKTLDDIEQEAENAT